MGKRLILLLSFFFMTPAFVLALVSYQSSVHSRLIAAGNSTTQIVDQDELPPIPNPVRIAQVTIDARTQALESFFVRYKSPLLSYAQKIVETADKYSLDYRLLPAIAMQESLLCKKAPKDSNNCWGFGIYGGKIRRFENFDIAIETVAKTLAHSYRSRGLEEPAEIMTRYTPANTNSWAENVSYVMDRIGAAF